MNYKNGCVSTTQYVSTFSIISTVALIAGDTDEPFTLEQINGMEYLDNVRVQSRVISFERSCFVTNFIEPSKNLPLVVTNFPLLFALYCMFHSNSLA